MIDRDPQIIVRNILIDGFDVTNTSLATGPKIHTGWYDYNAGGPQITVTNDENSVVNGGQTGVSGTTGAGGISQVRAGTLLVNGWAGRREDLTSAGGGGQSLNPKAVAWQLAKEIHRVLDEKANGTSHPSTGEPELNSLTADGNRLIVETDAGETVFRREITGRYTFTTRTA